MLQDLGAACALHLRARATGARALLKLAVGLEDAARVAGGWVVVNGRVDVALAAGVRAVQLGAGALPVAVARDLLGPDVAIGASVHDAEEAAGRVQEGADLLIAGTIYPTATHADRPVAGVGLLRACAALPVPVIAIGGVTPERVAAIRAAGASGVAAIRSIWEDPDPVAAARRLREAYGPERSR